MSLTDCLYQTNALARLERAARAGRIPHSMIFHGPQGVGKSTVARQWAKLMCCAQPITRDWPKDQDPHNSDLAEIHDCCDQCSDCHLADTGAHPDIHIVNRESAQYAKQQRKTQLINLPIDVIREFVIEPSTLRPTRGRARVFIVEEAETMNRASQNALLKTLEEPPPNTFIILITDKVDMFLPTIRSRCQLVRFNTLPYDFVAQKLQQHNCPADQAQYWARFCQGQLGPALALAQSDIYAVKCQFVEKLTQLDLPTLLLTAQWIIDTAKKHGEALLKTNPLATTGQTTRIAQAFFLQVAAETFRAVLRLHTGQADLLDQPQLIQCLTQKFSPKAAAAAIDATAHAQRLIDANVNATLIFESLMLDYLDAAAGIYATAG
ncbi:MAG: hypothetical protein JW936_04930 [Sedimentisphaerales bacterium]|nr:hypothetical protein [Sedimentisphaerales bacterium]